MVLRGVLMEDSHIADLYIEKVFKSNTWVHVNEVVFSSVYLG